MMPGSPTPYHGSSRDIARPSRGAIPLNHPNRARIISILAEPVAGAVVSGRP